MVENKKQPAHKRLPTQNVRVVIAQFLLEGLSTNEIQGKGLKIKSLKISDPCTFILLPK